MRRGGGDGGGGERYWGGIAVWWGEGTAARGAEDAAVVREWKGSAVSGRGVVPRPLDTNLRRRTVSL